jgi:hypothetical protein
VKECLIPIGIGSDTREILEALLEGGASCYGIDSLGEGPRLMITIDQQDERPARPSLDLL